MMRRSKFSSPAAFILAILVAVAGAVSRNQSKPRPTVSRVLRATPAPGKARVTSMVDGDTLHAMVAGPDDSTEPIAETIRLYGINTPESRPRPGTPAANFTPEPFSGEASDFLRKLCPPGTEITLQTHDRDRYNRLLAVIILPDGRDANLLLIEAGMARAYFIKVPRQDELRLRYEQAQAQAQRLKLGLWSVAKSN